MAWDPRDATPFSEQPTSAVPDLLRFVAWLLAASFILIGTCFAGLLVWVAASTADSAGVADEFLTSIEEGRIDNAYSLTAQDFRTKRDSDQFAAFVLSIELDRHQVEPWASRPLDGEVQTWYRGTVTDSSGVLLPYTLELVKEEDLWRVRSFSSRGWLLPKGDELHLLMRETMRDFSRAVQDKDFSRFFEGMSIARKLVITPAHFQGVFQHLIDDEVDFSSTVGVDAVLYAPARIDPTAFGSATQDVLFVEGYFPYEPLPSATGDARLARQVPFFFRYVREEDAWKLWQLWIGLPSTRGDA